VSGDLFACVHAAEFPAQALLRLRPELRGQPVAVLEGRAPLETVCSINILARKKGVLHGIGVPGLLCTSFIERNWSKRSWKWHEERSIHRIR